MSLVQANAGGVTAAVPIDRAAILQALNLNPRDPKVQALVLVCQQYGLDPVLKHAVLISGNLYVTRDGLLHVAHRDGRLDGIVVEEEGETADEWWARVAVHVKGQTHPYTYRGRYPKNGQQKRYGPEMAVKCAEVMALRRAFGVTGIATVEEQWEQHDQAIAAEIVTPPSPDDPLVDDTDRAALVAAMDGLPAADRKAAKAGFVQMFGLPQHLRRSQLAEAAAWVDEIVAGSATPDVLPGEGEPAPEATEEAANGGDGVASAEGAPPAPPEPDEDVPVKTRFHRLVDELATTADQAKALRHAVIHKVTAGATTNSQHATHDALEAAVELLEQCREGTWRVVDERLVLASSWAQDQQDQPRRTTNRRPT